MYFSSIYKSPLGNIYIVSDENELISVAIEGQKRPQLPSIHQLPADQNLPILKASEEWLSAYFEGKKPSPFDLPLARSGSEFRQIVMDLLLQIPYGSLRTYGDIAREIAQRRGIAQMASQAVGGAVGGNAISIIIPCHRVVGANGNLTGYGGGLDLKMKLLKHEGVDTSRFHLPR